MSTFTFRVFIAFFALMLAACQNTQHPPLPLAQVDLQRFMGDWYVIAATPTFMDRDAYNAVESYRLDADGTIATTYTFRSGGFDGPEKRYTPRGYVFDRQTNAAWGMQFMWPIKADYRIVYIASDYSATIVAREKRDYVWIMARRPEMADDAYERLLDFVVELGYDRSQVRRIPQRWPQASAPGTPR